MMRLKIHGCRGSHAVCTTPQQVEDLGKSLWKLSKKFKATTWSQFKNKIKAEPRSSYQIYGGNTTCLELKSDKAPMPVFFDAGTGLGAASMDPSSQLNNSAFKQKKGELAFFISHTHWDHILGLLTAEQIFKDGNEFHFYGVHKNLSGRIENLFRAENFPVPYESVLTRFHFHQIPIGTDLEFGDLTIKHCAQSHPGGSFAYRVEDGNSTLVFATDTELKNIDPPHMIPGSNIYTNADVLILDAQFSPEDMPRHKGFGHAQIETAVDFAVREKTKRLYLFHQSPAYDDSQIDRQHKRAEQYLRKNYGTRHPLKIFMTIEGEEIKV